MCLLHKNPSLSCEDDFPKGVPSRSYLGRKNNSRDILIYVLANYCSLLLANLSRFRLTFFVWKHIFEETIVCLCGVSLGEMLFCSDVVLLCLYRWFFPTCQVRVCRFLMKAASPPSSSFFLLLPSSSFLLCQHQSQP